MQTRIRVLHHAAMIIPLALIGTGSHAALVISPAATKNVTCNSGVCAATAKKAVLNVSQLQSLLASSSVKVVPGKKAGDIDVSAPLTWASSNSLTFDAYASIAVDKTVSVSGPGALTLTTNDGGKNGTLSFGAKGNVTFLGLTNVLTINGASYPLVSNIATLASDIAASPGTNYALAASYNAKGDGKYKASPIPTAFTGTFEGLGNTISRLTIDDKIKADAVGLFSTVNAGGVLRDIGIIDGNVKGGDDANVGELVGNLFGSVVNSWSTGSSKTGNAIADGASTNAFAGGLVGAIIAPAVVANSWSSATVTAGGSSFAGGLVGIVYNGGTVENSFATGNATVGSNTIGGAYTGGGAGGLVGIVDNTDGAATDIMTNDHATGNAAAGGSGSLTQGSAGGLIGMVGGPATISLCWASGAASAQAASSAQGYSYGGGLVGLVYLLNNVAGTIDQSFATGSVTGAPFSVFGGLVGLASGPVTNSYATGAVSQTGSGVANFGGLAGGLISGPTIGTSYSTGLVQLLSGSYVGGSIGYNQGTASDLYWDITTSGITNLAQGCGNISNCPGVTGDTTTQLQSGLPQGFDPKIWAENPNINGGLPYLLANQPPK